MEDANFTSSLLRIMKATKCTSIPQLAKFLGISSQAIYDAKKRNVFPKRWAAITAEKLQIQINSEFVPQDSRQEKSDFDDLKQELEKERCERRTLERELEQERQERRALAEENREMMRENRELNTAMRQIMKESAEIRERLARLEAEAKASHRTPGGGICGVA